MTLKECIDIVDNNKPNQYTIKDKVMWLSFIEGIIINEVLKTHEGYDGRYDDFKGYSEDKLSVTLVVPSPYNRLYTAYLTMMIDQHNGEMARYNNSRALYDSYLTEYRKHYHKTHMPLNASAREIPRQPIKVNSGLSDAEYENLKRDMTYILTEYFSSSVSPDKIDAIVRNYIQTNAEMYKGKDGYTPQKDVDYFDGEKGDKGDTPIRGVDYWTQEDQEAISKDLTEMLNSKVSIIDVPMRHNEETGTDEEVPIDEICDGIRDLGVWYIYQHYPFGYNENIRLYKLIVSVYHQYLTDCDGVVRKRSPLGNAHGWSEWEVCNNAYSPEEKEKLEKLPTNEELIEKLNDKISKITINIYDELDYTTAIYMTDLLDKYIEPGFYFIVLNYFDAPSKYWDGSYYYELTVTNDLDFSNNPVQYLKNCEDGVVRKRWGKGIDNVSWNEWEIIDNKFTKTEKAKLSALPTNEELSEKLNLKVPIIDVPMRYNEETGKNEEVPIDEICDELLTEGVYFIYQHTLNGISEEALSVYRLVVCHEDTMCQSLEHCESGVIMYRDGYGGSMGGDEWNEWVLINDTYSKTEIDDKLGDVEAALDELHNYAQALISGGEA